MLGEKLITRQVFTIEEPPLWPTDSGSGEIFSCKPLHRFGKTISTGNRMGLQTSRREKDSRIFQTEYWKLESIGKQCSNNKRNQNIKAWMTIRLNLARRKFASLFLQPLQFLWWCPNSTKLQLKHASIYTEY